MDSLRTALASTSAGTLLMDGVGPGFIISDECRADFAGFVVPAIGAEVA